MATYTITYAFTIGDSVWIIDGDSIIESTVKRIKLEVDPESGSLEEKITYYIDPIDKSCNLLEYPEANLFPSLESVLEYRITGVMPVLPQPYEQTYEYMIGDVVWVIEGARALESDIVQITIDVGKNITGGDASDVWYHVLPQSEKYSVRILKAVDIFDTRQDARDKILEDREVDITPTPTVTPEVTPTQTVTPTPTATPTPTVTPSVMLPYILTEDSDYIMTEDSDALLLE